MAWNRPRVNVNRPPRHKPTRLIVTGIAISLAAITATLVFSYLPANNESDVQDQAKRRIGDAHTSIKRKKPSKTYRSAEEAFNELVTPPKPEIKRRQLTPEQWESMTNRPFKTTTEQIMSWLVSVEPGDLPLPIPAIDEEDKRNLVSILISKNRVTDKDDENVAYCKEQVDHAKKEMAKYIGDGGDPDEFLQYYYNELRRSFEYRNEAVWQFQELKEDNPEIAEEFRRKVNEKLNSDGIKGISEEGY